MDGVNKAAGPGADNGGATASGAASSRGSLGGRQVRTASGEESSAPSLRKRGSEPPEAGTEREARQVALSKRGASAPRPVAASRATLPGPARSSADTPSEATATVHSAAVLQRPGAAAEPGLLPLPVDLPWLDPRGNAALPPAHSRMRALLERPDLPAAIRQQLSTGFETMTRIEREMVRVDALLRRTAREELTLSERSELERLVRSIRLALAPNYGMEDKPHGWKSDLIRIGCSGSWDKTVSEAARDLIDRHTAACDYFYSDEMPWEPTIRRLAVVGPARAEEPVTVERRSFPWVAPGGANQPFSSPALESGGAVAVAPDCALTTMTGADGRVRYSGISHRCARIRLTEYGAFRPGYADHFGQPSGGSVRPVADAISRAVVAQALLSDREKFERAWDGEIVDLELTVIPILQCEDTSAYKPQDEAYEALGETPLALPMRDRHGRARYVSANVLLQQVPVNVGWFSIEQALPVDWYALTKLLGTPGERELSGELSRKLDAMKTRLSELRASTFRQLLPVRPADRSLPKVEPAQNELRKLVEESARLERDSRTLEQAGMDFKSGAMGRYGTSENDETAIELAARIALVSSMVGRTPVLCYATGKDMVKRVESQIESLLGFASAHQGNIPMIQA